MAQAASNLSDQLLRHLLPTLSGARQEEAGGGACACSATSVVGLHCLWTVLFLGKRRQRRQAHVSTALPELPRALQAAAPDPGAAHLAEGLLRGVRHSPAGDMGLLVDLDPHKLCIGSAVSEVLLCKLLQGRSQQALQPCGQA